MEKVKILTSLELSRVIAGCMRTIDAGMDGEALCRFVHKCMELGIDSFDHAPVYGGGACEQIFGEQVLKKEPELRGKIKLITKAGIILPGQQGNKHIYYDSRKKSLLAEVDASLKRLCTDHVDLLLIHRPDVLGDPAEAADALEEIVASGKALNVGVSNYEPAQFEALQKYLSFPLAVNQMEFSVKSTYNFFNGVVDTAMRYGTGLMAWSPLGGGSVFAGADEQSVRLRTVIQKIADNYHTKMDVVMYAWILRHPADIMVITGTMNADRLKSAVDALELRLTYDEWYAILAASRGFDVP